MVIVTHTLATSRFGAMTSCCGVQHANSLRAGLVISPSRHYDTLKTTALAHALRSLRCCIVSLCRSLEKTWIEGIKVAPRANPG